MTDKKELSFTGINYSVCTYCKFRVGAPHRDGWNTGCGKKYVTGKGYARLTWCRGEVRVLKEKHQVDAMDELVGCEKFEASGLPIHPKVLEELVKNNPLIKTVPADSMATETSWDMEEKSQRYLPNDSFNKPLREIQ